MNVITQRSKIIKIIEETFIIIHNSKQSHFALKCTRYFVCDGNISMSKWILEENTSELIYW